MQKSVLYGILLSSGLFLNSVCAKEVDNTITTLIPITQYVHGMSKQMPAEKEVILMDANLTPGQTQKILNYKVKRNNYRNISSILPLVLDTGMNGTPVLDQGRHGSCVTFATTAAIDSLLGKGDYISQLCNLELGSYLEKRSYYPSGWNGSKASYVLDQMQAFGIVSKEIQKQKSCAGINEYPVKDKTNLGTSMSLEEFKQVSENIQDRIYWEPVMTFQQRLQWDVKQSDPGEETLLQVKQTLNTKLADATSPRVTFSVLLPVNYCHAGLCATYRALEDTWVLTKAMKNDSNPKFGGHEMIITGYDDKAIVTDNEGEKHEGLLYIRNSWGEDVGDHGNYYMTYDFFKSYVTSVQKIAFRQDRK